MIQWKGTVAVIMTMTREKAIETLENHTQYYAPIQDLSALKMALTALRGPTREMVEKVFPGCDFCKKELDDYAAAHRK